MDQNHAEKPTAILRRKQVEARTGLSRSTIYNRLQEGTFPKPVNLGPRSVGWLESEVEAWLRELVEERDSEMEVH